MFSDPRLRPRFGLIEEIPLGRYEYSDSDDRPTDTIETRGRAINARPLDLLNDCARM